MNNLFSFFETTIVTGIIAAALVATLFLLLLSIPKSRLSSFMKQVVGQVCITLGYLGYLACGAFVVYVLSPINLLPLIPIDEFVAVCGALGSFGFGWMARKQGIVLIDNKP